MRSTVRSLTFGLAGLLSAGAMAQYPYTIALSGTVTNCYPGQVVTVQTIQGTLPQQSFTVALDSNTCSYSVFVSVSNVPAWLEVTTLCGGMIQVGADSSQFDFVGDTATSVINLSCGGGQVYDCTGMLNGPNMPGTPCSDNNPNTINDIWSPACACVGTPLPPNCNAAFGIWEQAPWVMGTANASVGMAPFLFNWTLPDGSTSTESSPSFTFNAPGTYGICLTITTADACTSTTCDTVYVDSTGAITTTPDYIDCMGIPNGPAIQGTPCQIPGTTLQGAWDLNCFCDSSNVMLFDCLGYLNGPNMPGTFCIDFFGDTGVWSPSCVCEVNSGAYDCLGQLNGPNMPGTGCTYYVNNMSYTGLWSPACVCGPDSSFMQYDCLGMLNGPNMPGTACNDGNPATLNDTWNSACVCTGNTPNPCQADFWVLQAFDSDSLPIPYELWVWNLSNGGNGNYTYLWSFGDGTSSTEAYPTHTYSGSGPYVLCLTIADNNGCTDQHCDSISIDGNGMYSGMVGGGTDRQDGFTINVQNPQANSVDEHMALNDIVAWPNPVVGDLNIAMVSDMHGAVDVTITDLNGRVVCNERRTLNNGRNQLRLNTEDLGAGLYMLRIGNDASTVSLRFVKTN